ncbi:hypothetical protein GCM10025859_14460 [Alicyclobacillus fastidiosus]|nr:hypothetical protein GCM10025859_14460 [Alicyclobacillus fastidiosus]
MIRDHDFVSCMEQGCESWRCGDDLGGLSWFQMACLLWLDGLMRPDEEDTENRLSDNMVHLVTQMLRNMLDHLRNEDITRATDILEYELLPVLRARNTWQSVEWTGG